PARAGALVRRAAGSGERRALLPRRLLAVARDARGALLLHERFHTHRLPERARALRDPSRGLSRAGSEANLELGNDARFPHAREALGARHVLERQARAARAEIEVGGAGRSRHASRLSDPRALEVLLLRDELEPRKDP